MKILRLKLCNLASLAGEQELDYRAEPLASAGLMAITGPTGSGKSTILDAMCLALFGQVPRLRAASKGQEGKVPDGLNNDPLSMHDSRTLLRRGAAEGYAEVEFLGRDGHIYLARWQVRRARNKSTGKLLAAERILIDIGTGQTLASQVRECDLRVSELIGLNFEQFTRAVMLAQSEFGAFLKASDVERAQLLERLLETEIYRRIGAFAHEKRKKYYDAYQLINTQIGGIQPLDIDSRQTLDNALLLSASHRAQLQTLQTHLNATRDWYLNQTRLKKQIEESHRILGLSAQHLLDLAPLRLKSMQLDQIREIRPVIQQQQALAERMTVREQSLAQQKLQSQTTREKLTPLEPLHRDAENQWLALQQQKTESLPQIMNAQRLEHEIVRIQHEQAQALAQADLHHLQITKTDQELANNVQQQAAIHEQQLQIEQQLERTKSLSPFDEQWSSRLERMKEAERYTHELNLLQMQIPAHALKLQQSTTALQQFLLELEQHQELHATAIVKNQKLHAMKQQQSLCRQTDAQLQMLAQKYQDYRHVLRTAHELETKQKLALTRKNELTQNIIETQKSVQHADLELTTLLKVLNTQRLVRHKNVEALRDQLRPDQPCPVCGSTEHPFSVAEHLIDALNSDDEEQEKSARRNVLDAQNLHQSVATELRLLDQEIDVRAAELKLRTDEERAIKGQMLKLPFATELRAISPEDSIRLAWITERIQSNQVTELSLQAEITALEVQQGIEQEFLKKIEQARLMQTQSQQIWQNAIDQQEQLKIQIDQTLQYFWPLFDAGLQQKWQDNIGLTLATLQTQMTARLEQLAGQKRLQDEKRALHQSQQLLSFKQSQAIDKQKELEVIQRKLSIDLTQNQSLLIEVLNLATSTFNQVIKNSQDWQLHLDEKLLNAQQTLNTLNEQIKMLNLQLQKLTSSIEHAGHQQGIDEQEKAVLTSRIHQWHQSHQIDSEELFQVLLAVSADEELSIKQQLEQAQHQQIVAKTRLTEHEAQLDLHLLQIPRDLNANDLAQPSQVMVLETEVEQRIQDNAIQLEQAHKDWMSLQLQISQDNERQAKASALQHELDQAYAAYLRVDRMASPIANADGKVFQKIAQGYYLDLLLEEANQQLEQLSRRYQLVRAADSLGLLVIDTDMGDERRSVHSLSGGESFLVSLALALGLAAMASGRLRIESLFIDEGFGTLDPESLQVVMDALDRLQGQGRVVTVITHVQEMHERIPTQIRVVKLGNGQSQLTVI